MRKIRMILWAMAGRREARKAFRRPCRPDLGAKDAQAFSEWIEARQ